MRKRIFALFITLTILVGYIPPLNVEAGVVGNSSGYFEPGGTTGPGGGAHEIPSFRIGIAVEKFAEPLSDDKLTADSIQEHYVDHFPSMGNSIIFSPPEVYVNSNNAVVGWYEQGTGRLQYLKDDAQQYKHRTLYGDRDSSNLYYAKLLAIVGDSDGNGKPDSGTSVRSLKGKWQTVMSSGDDALALKRFRYFFGEWNSSGAKDFNTKFKEYLKIDTTPEDALTVTQKNERAIAYIDMMMLLYQVAAPTQKSFYASEIDRFIAGGNEVLENPPLIAVDTVTRMMAPNSEIGTKKLFMTTISWLEYYAGITTGQRLIKPNEDRRTANSTYKSDHAENLIEHAIRASVNEKPNVPRASNQRSTTYVNNAFAYGHSIITGDMYLTTAGGGFEKRPSSSVSKGLLEYVHLNGLYDGFMILDASAIDKTPMPSGTFALMAEDPKATAVPQAQTQIGQRPTITIRGTMEGTQLTDWIGYIDKKNGWISGYPKIKINLDVTGDATLKADTGGALSTSNAIKGNDTWISISPDTLKAFVKGEQDIDFSHDLIATPIAENQKLRYDYTATVEVKLGDKPDEQVIFTGKPDTDFKEFFRGKDTTVSFISEPEYYGEIKTNDIYNEPFDAMAGTPTTKDLYFAAGGSEFIVSATFEYVEDLEATRTYRSYFTGGVPSEFYEGDKSPNKTVEGYSMNMDLGDSKTKTWTGSIPNNASAVTALHSASCPAEPDRSAYDADLAEAQAFAARVNATVVSHTAASDGITRSFNAWGATVNPNPVDPVDTSASASCKKRPPTKTSPGKPCQNEMATASPSGPGHYTITVTWGNGQRVINGPEDRNNAMPLVEDTWIQKFTYDVMRITGVSVWKIHEANVDGMYQLIATDEVRADIVQGDPNIFYNISSNEDSTTGRLRYTLEPEQHDVVVWNEGPRTNKSNGLGTNPYAVQNPITNQPRHAPTYSTGILYTNNMYGNVENFHDGASDDKDKQTIEYAKFDERRKLPVTVNLVSDYLVLQTSSGDQCLLYYNQESESKQAQQNFLDMQIDRETFWDNNYESAYRLEPEDINYGSYNGDFSSTKTKYEPDGDNHKTLTIMDNDIAKTITRPPRPTQDLRLYKKDLDIPDTSVKNGEYITGDAKIFYKEILKHNNAPLYSSSYSTLFGDTGLVFDLTYSPSHGKINNVVIHNPVASEYAMVIPTPESLDQRTDSTKFIGGNQEKDTKEFVKQLKSTHDKQNFIFNGDAELLSNNGQIVNWKANSPKPEDTQFTYRTGDQWKISGDKTFEIRKPATADYKAFYETILNIPENEDFTFRGKIGAHRCIGYFEIDAIDATGAILQSWKSTNSTVSTISTKTIGLHTPINTTKLNVRIVLEHDGTVESTTDYVFADDLELTLNNGESATWTPMKYTVYEDIQIPNPDYVTPYTIDNPEYIAAHTIPNPDYIAPVNEPSVNCTTSWIATSSGRITVNLYGSGGGYYQHKDHEKYYVSSQTGTGYRDVVKGDELKWTGQTLYHNGQAIGAYSPGPTGRMSAGSCSDAEDAANGSGGGRVWPYHLTGFYYSGPKRNSFTTIGKVIPGNGQPEFLNIEASGEPTILINNANYVPAVVEKITSDGGDKHTFNYTGTTQTFKAPFSGNYQLEVWGAQGGGSSEGSYHNSAQGGNGGYAKGVIKLDKDEILKIYVGGQGSLHNGGYNGGGSAGQYGGGGGGATDIRYLGTGTANRVIVAGGGGGASGGSHPANGGAGGGMESTAPLSNHGSTGAKKATQSSGYSLGNGESNTSYHYAGGGGGYYGGFSGYAQPGAGGSGYIGGVDGGTWTTGVRAGHGRAVITELKAEGINIISPAKGVPYIPDLSPTITVSSEIDKTVSKPPESWYETVIKTIPANPITTVPGLGTVTAGKFIVLDRGFQVYFPNEGDFYGDGAKGIDSTTDIRGAGFVDNMDTTEWTKRKVAKFDYNVIFEGKMYPAGAEVDLDVHEEVFDFYLPLANKEATSANVDFFAIAINGDTLDNTYTTNRARAGNKNAKHSAIKTYTVDVIGRIGSLVIEDTGDFRFSNFFKKPITPLTWYIENLLYEVDVTNQNKYIGPSVDILDVPTSDSTKWLNRWDTLPHLESKAVGYPLSPSLNTEVALVSQPLRLGYPVMMDIQTIGNYYHGMQIVPYYYHLNLNDGTISPVDMYIDIDGEFEIINDFGAAQPGWDPTSVYEFAVDLDWDDQKARRNFSAKEATATKNVVDNMFYVDKDGNEMELAHPQGNDFVYGTAQIMRLSGRNRTFIGQDTTNDEDKNPGDLILDFDYNKQAQRWHFTIQTPSSARFVLEGKSPIEENFNEVMNSKSCIVTALDIISIGDTYMLGYKHPGGNGIVNIVGRNYALSSIPQNVITISSSNRSAADDLDIKGTH